MNSAKMSCIVLTAVMLAMTGCKSSGTGSASSVAVRSDSNPWFRAATSNSDVDLNAAAASGADINAHERRDRSTPLHVAAIAGNENALRFMLSHGAQIDALDEDGRPALVMACHRARTTTAIALIQANADLNLLDGRKQTALMFAAREGLLDVVNAMIAAKAPLDLQSTDGFTALYFAALHGHTDVVVALRNAGANTTLHDRRNRTPLDVARIKHHADVVQVLGGP